MNPYSGIAASGHKETSRAAAVLLEAGGNAFDAALGAMCAACVAEPMLASLGGGGFMLAQPSGQPAELYDFFVQTPARKRPVEELDFYPILADFGTATQEFHVGMGSMAVPGVIAGLFEVHRRRCRLPVREIVAPAIALARNGVRINRFQNYINHILSSILESSAAAMQLVATREAPDRIAAAGEVVYNQPLADVFEALARQGPDFFYRGELAEQLSRDSRERGGMLTREDLSEYTALVREPVRFSSHGASFAFNSPPSPSGCLIAFALGLLEDRDLQHHTWGHAYHCEALVEAMEATSRLRRESRMKLGLDDARVAEILDSGHLARWREALHARAEFSRGTTHLSVADQDGNLASLTVSNGEGCAYVIPGTGIMMNNMLGEEDLNPGGFHLWAENRRMSSMMCPSVASLPDGGWVALGSGGSNRIRSAILQVLVNLFEFNMDLDQAVSAPRVHLEHAHLSVERGFSEPAIAAMSARWPDHRLWPEPNMFFGGVHAVEILPDGRFRAAGDHRRGGAIALAH